MAEKLVYRNPKENMAADEDKKMHTIEIEVDGELVGGADIHYLSKPFPLYQITDLWIEFDEQGKGYGSKVMDYIEKMLLAKRRPGVLVDAIDPESPASGMYARRGWVEIPGLGGLHVFNLPKGAKPENFVGYPMRYTDLMERPGFKEIT